MILQYYFERPENVDTLKVSMVQVIFTITWLQSFKKRKY